MFRLQKAERVEPDRVDNKILQALYEYWNARRGSRTMPESLDLDAPEISENAGRMHLLEVEGASVFRYRLYGARVTNPDRIDMTGRTTMGYADTGFGLLVTAHMAEAAAKTQPTCYRISGEMYDQPYVYIRIILPLGRPDGTVTHLLVGTQRIDVPAFMDRPAQER